MSQQILTESLEKTKQRIARRETRPASAQLFQGGLHPIAQLQRTLGNRNVAQLIQAKQLTPGGKIIGLQRKLTVGAADDQYEQEADRVARQVLNTPDAVAANSMQRAMSPEEDKDQMLQTKPLAASITPFVQRQMVNNEESEDKEKPVQAKFFTGTNREPVQRQPETEEEEKEPIQTKSAGSLADSFEAGADVETQVSLSKGRGSPLPDSMRAYMEPRFGADFSQVRVHTGSDARQMNQAVGAQAFTHGSDIYFGAGSSPTNLELTAHELTHVIQQTGSQPLQTKKRAEEGAPPGPEPSIQRICAACAADDRKEKGSEPIALVGQSIEKRGLSPITPTQVLALQCLAGNAAVTRSLARPAVQRANGEVQQQEQDQDLHSPRFAGDPLLEACLDDKARLGMGARGDSVRKIQQALTDLGRVLPSGVDGIYGAETWNAVRQFKIDEQLTPSTFGDVGPKTMARLDQMFPGGGGLLPPCPQGPDDIVAGGEPEEVTTTAFVGATPVSAALIPGVTCQLVRPPVSRFPPTRLADLSPAESARLVVKTTSTLQTEIDAAYIPFRSGSTVRNTATITPPLTFGTSVPEDREVRQGVLRVASTVRNSTPPSLVPGTTQTLAVNDQPIRPDPQKPPTGTVTGGLFRFTNYMHGRTEVILVERLGPVPARIRPLGDTIIGPFLSVARAEFAAMHPGMTVGAGWRDAQEIGVLDDAVTRMGTAATRAGNLTFDRSGRTVGGLSESGHFDPNTRHIEIFQSAFTGGVTRFGGSEMSTFTICHEVAHAVSDSDAGLRAAFAQAAARDGTPTTAGRLTGAVTEYGNTSMEEYLAEAMALRGTAPDVLTQLRPNIAAFLNRRF